MTEQATPPTDDAPTGDLPSVALVKPEDETQSVVQRLRARWDPANVELIRQTVAKDCTPAELGLFLELAARYELDPFAKQIWAARMGGSSGPVSIFAGRDGFLAIADRNPDFGGMIGDTVREHDLFEKKVDEDGVTSVNHEPRTEDGKPTGSPKKRGDIVGAWALVYRQGRKPTYFFADYDEYYPKYTPPAQSPWKKQVSAMILKCAEATALRKAYTITGIVGAEEVDAPAPGQTAMQVLTQAPDGPDYGRDPVVANRLEKLFDLLEYGPRKRVVKLAGEVGTGRTDAELAALVTELIEEAKQRGVDVPPLDDIDAEEVTAEPVADAA